MYEITYANLSNAFHAVFHSLAYTTHRNVEPRTLDYTRTKIFAASVKASRRLPWLTKDRADYLYCPLVVCSRALWAQDSTNSQFQVEPVLLFPTKRWVEFDEIC